MSQCGSWEREKLPSGGNPLEELCVCGVSEGQQWGQGRHEGELSPSLSREEESKPTQQESSLCKQPSHTWANPQNWDKVSKRWEIHPPAAFSSVSSAGRALMCWLHYFPTSPGWMADLWRERCTITPSFPGHKDRERSWDHVPYVPCHRPWVCHGGGGTLLPCADVRSGEQQQGSRVRVSLHVTDVLFIPPLWKLISGNKPSNFTWVKGQRRQKLLCLWFNTETSACYQAAI